MCLIVAAAASAAAVLVGGVLAEPQGCIGLAAGSDAEGARLRFSPPADQLVDMQVAYMAARRFSDCVRELRNPTPQHPVKSKENAGGCGRPCICGFFKYIKTAYRTRRACTWLKSEVALFPQPLTILGGVKPRHQWEQQL